MARKSKKIKSSKALVKYDNKFNESSLSSLNPIEIKLLHAIISQIKDQGTSEVVIPFENLKALISLVTNMMENFIVFGKMYLKFMRMMKLPLLLIIK